MERENWQKVKAVFDSVIHIGTDERSAFLKNACADDAELRSEVESLLSSSDAAESFMERPFVGEIAELLADGAANRLEPGQVFSRYKIIRQIGVGGMGEVYLAKDSELERLVALKVLPDEVASDKQRIGRFVQEAKAASALNHPNILTIYEIGTADNSRYIASEFIKGETLREKIDDQTLDLQKTLEIAIQIASALEAAHASGIVHRDIKPDNVMLRDDGLVKVLDFGLAKLHGQQTLDMEAPTRAQVKTQTGMILGTPAYMSPEQARGKPLDARTDIWSLGVVLYEMLTKQQPFAGETHGDTLAAILKTEAVPTTRFNPEVPAELDRIVRKTLQKKVDERYQTAKDLLIDLKSLKHDLEFSEERTASTNETDAAETRLTKAVTIGTAQSVSGAAYVSGEIKKHKLGLGILSVLIFAVTGFGYWFFVNRSVTATPMESIAVMPFVNESGNADVEYLSDGMTETLISSLSQLPKLSVKARSSVFRYKGKDADAQTIAKELNVQAILTGKVVQRGQDLSLYVELVEVASDKVIWSETYNRPITDLVALQSDVARDVSNKLQLKLSGADGQKLTKSYTTNAQAYQLYMKGRFHLLKGMKLGIETAISYFQQAIEVDPNYALAYAGLADAYRGFSLGGEMPSDEFMPKARAAAKRAIEIDDTLAEAHANLGHVMFWYDWDWNAAEKEYKRALELDPNSPDALQFYAHLLTATGRHAEALAKIKLARELDPVNLRVNAIEGMLLMYAGQTDEAIARLQKTLEMDPNFRMANMMSARVYIEKGMFSEAIAATRKTRELSTVNSAPIAFGAYALAKSGKITEARAALDEMLRFSKTRWVPPYNFALVHNALGEQDKALDYLEKSFAEKDVRMVFLKVEPTWNNLRSEPRFKDLIKRMNFE